MIGAIEKLDSQATEVEQTKDSASTFCATQLMRTHSTGPYTALSLGVLLLSKGELIL